MSGAALLAASRGPTLTVSITGGQILSGTQHAVTMTPGVASVSNGSGSYSYAWSLIQTAGDTSYWDMTGQGTASVSPTVHAAFVGENSQATLTCTVTDNVTGAHATSNTVLYQYINTE